MTFASALKFLYDNKLVVAAPGWAAIVLIGLVEVFQIKPLHSELIAVQQSVNSILVAQAEEQLDATYAALCQNPGDAALLERIRERQQRYYRMERARYTPPSCTLLMKMR